MLSPCSITPSSPDGFRPKLVTKSLHKNRLLPIDESNLIVRTRADVYPEYSDERYKVIEDCGSQIITTDFPEKINGNEENVYSFNGKKIKLIKN